MPDIVEARDSRHSMYLHGAVFFAFHAFSAALAGIHVSRMWRELRHQTSVFSLHAQVLVTAKGKPLEYTLEMHYAKFRLSNVYLEHVRSTIEVR